MAIFSGNQSQSYSTFIYGCYLFILFSVPIAQSRHDSWPALLVSCLVFSLGLVVFTETIRKKTDILASLYPSRLPILLLFLVCAWVFIQVLPLPVSILDKISVIAASSYQDIDRTSGHISLAPGDTMIKGTFSVSLLIFFILTLLLHTSEERIRLTLLVVVLSGTCQALYGSFMVLSGLEYGFFGEKTAYLGVATGTFYNRNHLAGYLEMSLACGIGLLVSTLGQGQGSRWRARLRAGLDALLGPKMRLRVFLAFMVIALVLTRSRMGNTAFFASLIICSGLYMLAERKINWGAIILFASLMLVDFLIVGQWFGFDELAERLENTSAQTEQRDEIAGDSWNLIMANPVTGYGLGSYYSAFQLYQEDDVQAYYDHAHNDYLEFTADLGLIGIIPLALLVLVSAWKGISSLFGRRDRLARGAGFAAFMGILSMLIHASVEFNLQITANALLFVFLLALGWISASREWRSA